MNPLKALITTTSFLYAAAALAISLPVAEDTFTTTSGSLASGNGKAPTLLLNANQAVLLQFDFSALPPAYNATNILSAKLKIYVTRAVTPGNLQVFPITSAWTESVTTNTAMPSFDPTSISTVPATKLLDKRFLIIDVTSQVAADLTGTRSNFGFLLRDSAGQIRIPSKEGPMQGPSAQIEIDANLALDANGSGSFPGSLSVGSNLNLAGLLRQGA